MSRPTKGCQEKHLNRCKISAIVNICFYLCVTFYPTALYVIMSWILNKFNKRLIGLCKVCIFIFCLTPDGGKKRSFKKHLKKNNIPFHTGWQQFHCLHASLNSHLLIINQWHAAQFYEQLRLRVSGCSVMAGGSFSLANIIQYSRSLHNFIVMWNRRVAFSWVWISRRQASS